MTRREAIYLLGLNALLSAGLFAIGSHWIAARSQIRVAVLDVGELYREKESRVAALLVNHQASQAERQSALDRATAFGAEVTALLGALPTECRCLVLSRGAVIGAPDHLADLTPDVRRRLGL